MSIFITKRESLGTTTGIGVIVVLAMMKRLEQLESTLGVIDIYEFLVPYETV